MRTLSRPMFNMGGPIKQGIMHGIREPYAHGTRAALVGNPIFPKDKTGRAHHMNPYTLAATGVARVAPRVAPHVKRGYEAFKNIFRGTPTGQVPGWAPLTTGQKIKSWFASAPAGKYLAGSPEGRLLSGGAGWAGAAGKKIGSVLKGAAKSPLTVGAGAWYGVPWAGKKLFGDDDEAVVTGVMKPGGYPEGTGTGKGKGKELTSAERDAFAKSQREARLNKYLQMMGYDQSKKTAIADALIDASKIVSDRGTLDRKNITGELINPIIQATSARLDKPQQIREAVGLMMTKGEIEKDLEDPTVKALRMKQLEKLDREASPGISRSIMAYMASKKDDVKGKELVDLVRLAANEEGTPFKFISEEEIAKIPEMEGKTALEIVSSTAEADGVYMIGDAVIEVKGGVPTQIK